MTKKSVTVDDQDHYEEESQHSDENTSNNSGDAEKAKKYWKPTAKNKLRLIAAAETIYPYHLKWGDHSDKWEAVADNANGGLTAGEPRLTAKTAKAAMSAMEKEFKTVNTNFLSGTNTMEQTVQAALVPLMERKKGDDDAQLAAKRKKEAKAVDREEKGNELTGASLGKRIRPVKSSKDESKATTTSDAQTIESDEDASKTAADETPCPRVRGRRRSSPTKASAGEEFVIIFERLVDKTAQSQAAMLDEQRRQVRAQEESNRIQQEQLQMRKDEADVTRKILLALVGKKNLDNDGDEKE